MDLGFSLFPVRGDTESPSPTKRHTDKLIRESFGRNIWKQWVLTLYEEPRGATSVIFIFSSVYRSFKCNGSVYCWRGPKPFDEKKEKKDKVGRYVSCPQKDRNRYQSRTTELVEVHPYNMAAMTSPWRTEWVLILYEEPRGATFSVAFEWLNHWVLSSFILIYLLLILCAGNHSHFIQIYSGFIPLI